MTEAVPPQAAKLDPETLAIRARPPRAIRFKRGVIIAIAALGSVSLVAVTWVALKPRLVHGGDDQPELSQPNARPMGDGLDGAPATYGEVPRLGPPLPGDLGKPILERQRQLASGGDFGSRELQQAETSRREGLAAELKAARQSGVLVQDRQASAVAGPTIAASSFEPEGDAGKVALEPDRDPNAQGRKAAFVSKLDVTSDINPHVLSKLASPYTLSAGSVIAASLITGLRSDLPGLVVAQVTQNTYDSATGRILLVPQGSRLIGSYDSVVAFGQKRALVVWQRIVMPDGRSLRIENVPATDAAGHAGVTDTVDLHTWQLLKGVALSTLLGVSSELVLAGQGDLVRAIRMSTQDTVSRAGDQITQRNLGVQPTITVRPGAPIYLVVHEDLVFAPTGKEGSDD